MKREQLKELGLEDAAIDKIMALHGADIETHKGKVTELQGQLDTANTQITEANAAIEGFKKLNPEQLQAAADEWKTKFEQAQEEAKNQLAQVKSDHALEKELKEVYKVKDPADVIPHLKRDALKLGDDGKFTGLKEQIDPLKTSKDYLFQSDKPTPKLVTNTNNKPVTGDALADSMRKGAGLPVGTTEET